MLSVKKVIIYICGLLLLASCNGQQTTSSVQGGDTLQLKYASLLSIVDLDGYSVVEIQNPWKTGKTLHRYVLVENASAQIPEKDQSSVIHTPLTQAAVFTTVHCSLLMNLDCQDKIAAVADLQYIKIPWIHEQVSAGRIADCGNGLNPVVEKIMDVKPDAILLSPFENSGGYGKTEDLGIPIVECAEYMEDSPLGRAEWMKFYGRLFGKREKADSLFVVVDSNYHALCRQAQELGEGRRVLVDKMVGNVWYVPGGKSTIGQMVRDAGGRSPWADDDHSGSLSLSFEAVLENAADCDVWLFRYSANHSLTREELLSEHHGYTQFKSFREGELYGCNVEQTLFYEEAPFRPDYLLSDFIQMVHPDKTQYPLKYFENVRN